MWSFILQAAFCLTAVLSLPADRSFDLFTLDSSVSTLDVAACDEDDVISCISASINPAAIDANQMMVEGVLWTKVQPHVDQVNDGSLSAEFSSPDGSTAGFTIRDDNMFGAVEFIDGSVYLLENCGENCHVWMELDTDLEEDGDDEFELSQDDTDMRDMRYNYWYTDLQNQGKEDQSTIVEFSIMIYYTPEFLESTSDVQTYVDAVIAETNQGYINSLIPIRIKIHCLELAKDLHDIYDSSKMINAFRKWGGSNIRRSADAAALLVDDFKSCGIGAMAGYRHNGTITVSQKSCALGYFSFGHELGHNMAATHDKDHGSNSYFSYGFGKHIGPKYLGGGRGFRTIMAYNALGYAQRKNYYSNPDVQFLEHDTGSAGEDNARVITENRFVMAAIGDESEACAATTSAPPTTTEASSSTSPTTNNECKDGFFVKGQNLKKALKTTDGYECQQRCLNTDGCNWFSYYMPQYQKKKMAGKCFLKKNQKKMKKRKDVFSGSKTCYTT